MGTFPYPEFLPSSRCCTDAFWRSIFIDLSRGTPPIGAVFDGRCLRFVGRDAVSIDLDVTTDPLGLYTAVVQSLVVAGAQPAYKRLQCNTVTATPWTELKRKGIKYQFLELFVLDEMSRVGFPIEVALRAILAMEYLISAKKILPVDINFDGFRVRSIAGIEFSKTSFTA